MAQVQFVGHIGREPESRVSDKGVTILSFSVAENDYRNNQEHTNWFDVTVFNGFAESLMQRQGFGKGSHVFIAGDLRIEDFTRQDGSKGRAVRVIANKVQLLGRREASQREQAEERIAPRPRQQQATTDGDYDDLPF